MKYTLSIFIIFFALIVSAKTTLNESLADEAQVPLKSNPEWIEKTETCKTNNPKKIVYFFKQRHLDMSTNTKRDNRPQAQAENQYAIYDQLKKWIDEKKLDTILAEGCAGEITKSFAQKFNGWSMNDLIEKKKESKNKKDNSFDKILTHIPMKLKALYGDNIHATCADNEKEIKAQLLEMSDIRGDMGFLKRIQTLKDKPDQQKSFIDGAIEILKLPKDSSAETAINALKKDINEKIKEINEGLSIRNQSVIEAIKKESATNMALVFGGMHAKEIKQLLEKENIGCEILTPKGYGEENP